MKLSKCIISLYLAHFLLRLRISFYAIRFQRNNVVYRVIKTNNSKFLCENYSFIATTISVKFFSRKFISLNISKDNHRYIVSSALSKEEYELSCSHEDLKGSRKQINK